MDDGERERIRGYMQAQAAKLSPAALVDKVRAAMAELAEAARAVPAARFGERPAPAEWSGNEVMAHVVHADAWFGGGILAILGDRPLPPRGQGQGAEGAPLRTADAWLATLARARDALFAQVLAVEAGARLERTIEHPFFGPLNWRETLLFTRLHDLDHAGQLRKIVTALG